MRNRFMITISDIHGSKQYTLHQLVRRLALWIIVFIILLFAIGVIIIKVLSLKVDHLDELTSKLKNSQKVLLEENKKLEAVKSGLLYERKLLQKNIDEKTSSLNSMNNKLSEIEKIIGLKPNVSDAFDERADAVKRKSWHKINKAKLTVQELSLLNKSVPTGFPIKNYKRISDGFGYRIHPITHKRTFHFGVDFAAKTGTPVYATADGVVAYARRNGGYGNFLLIYNPFGFSTAYGHLSKYAVKEGKYIYKGDLVGYVGNTGRSTGSHLHYEIRYLQKWLNPQSFFHWSEDNYKKIMKKESLVKWVDLLNQLHTRYLTDNITLSQK